MQGEQTSVVFIILCFFKSLLVWGFKFFFLAIIAALKRPNITNWKTLIALK